MPYRWDPPSPDPSHRRLTLWPHRSLPPRGFAAFILATFAMFMIPVFAVLGTNALWGLLPYILGALGLTWTLLRRSYRDGTLREILTFDADAVELVRIEPDGRRLTWQANPYWVRVKLHPTGRPVENYLTLQGGPREVELGAFLSPEERKDLAESLPALFGR